MAIELVSFDLDGVLADSLPTYLWYSRHVANYVGEKVIIPDVEEFREIARTRSVTPLDNFFRAIGFREESIPRALTHCERNFHQYNVELFEGIPGLLKKVNNLVPVGLITANTIENAKKFLGDNMKYFDQRFVRSKEDGVNKSDHLKQTMQTYGYGGSNIIFVGDTLGDYNHAKEAGVEFIGATYGFELSKQSRLADAELVSDIKELNSAILRRIRKA
jgi:phosphoglycolate phosphatase-like HAD superfamily hydrolase